MTNVPAAPASVRRPEGGACRHQPRCPDARAPDRIAARAVAAYREQEWSLLWNGVVLFDDTGTLLPDSHATPPPPAPTEAAAPQAA
jgi:hypothetical protein